MEAPETQFAKTPDGLRIGYQVVGDGPADLICVLPAQLPIDIIWEYSPMRSFLARLASLARVILFDPRGCGASDYLTPTLDSYLEDIHTAADAAGSTHASLFGFSEGGFGAMLFAASSPERTSSLVLFNTYAKMVRDEDYECGWPDGLAKWLLDNQPTMWGTGMNVLANPSMAEDGSFRSWVAKCERVASPVQVVAGLFRDWLARDMREVLPAIRVPTLVLHRTDNDYVRTASGRYLTEHIPGATYKEVPGGDHYFCVGDQGAILDEVEEFVTGSRPATDADRVLATVLFTDIESSTERAARIGDRGWTQLLDRHDEITTRELDRHRGRKVNPTGDGVLATFDGPARAVRCAQSIIESVRPLGIEVRAGLHTGEVELRGDDIGGIAVHIGQRVSALAGPGEVLVSRTVTDLVAGSGLAFEERGEHELKGVPGKWAIYAVVS